MKTKSKLASDERHLTIESIDDWFDDRLTKLEDDYDKVVTRDEFDDAMRSVFRDSELTLRRAHAERSFYVLGDSISAEEDVFPASLFIKVMRQAGVFLSFVLALGVAFFGEIAFSPLFLTIAILLMIDQKRI